MEANVFVGHHCPKCGTTIATAVSVGGALSCPGCGGPMIPAAGGPRTTVIANFKCDSCGTQIGMMSVAGDGPKCPTCQAPVA